ncbi:MAG: hypothetical protein RL557_471, partial [archaeon]
MEEAKKEVKETEEKSEKSFKEQRIREITFLYYSRSDVKKALFEFAKNRETVPRYFEGFGKRPDSFQYESDILEQVKKGATSFHCSEELWSDPLELSTGLARQELDNMRTGWDLLIDIDSPYLEYSKIYAHLIAELLGLHNIENFGVKFSGSKGFHFIIPWKAFPKEIYNQQTKDMFPEWPRIICQYLAETIKPRLAEKIFADSTLKELAEKTGKKESELIVNECLSCQRNATKKYEVTLVCTNCKNLGEVVRIETNKRVLKCPECRKPLIEKSRREVLFCEYCSINSVKNPELFAKARKKTELLIDADLVLVAPRHLFRMPYSLHEKTALASIVVDKSDIPSFEITHAKPFKMTIKNFYPDAKENEARELILQALDWHEQKEKTEHTVKDKKDAASSSSLSNQSKKDFSKITIPNPSNEIFPPQIQLLLKGLKQDGRKRALFVLLSFFTSLGVPHNEIEKRIDEWNQKNAMPLKKGYVISQLQWYKRNPNRLPPNFSNPIYKDLGVDFPDKLSLQTKNPVSYAIKKYFML